MTVHIRRVDLASEPWQPLVRRSATPDPDVVAGAAAIVAGVADGGDAAVARYSAEFGGALADGTAAVPREVVAGARDRITTDLRDAIEAAIANVTAVHRPQLPLAGTVEPVPGVSVERVWSPVSAAGVYVPGGRARYPSSLIMGVVPARVAGVGRIVVTTPADPSGMLDPAVLAAADLLGVDEVYAVGGAQAVAALAHGTETIDRVDVIVGPGGPWVTAAKIVVSGECGIDLPAGPSEAVVLADGDADPRIVAADVMCQAEHGEESAVVLVTDDEGLVRAVEAEIVLALGTLERADTIRSALANHGLFAIATDIEQAITFANAWAPEHLSVHTRAARAHAEAIPNAGSVFIGHWTAEAAGDYATGANHVLPTGGLARSRGPLSVEDFGSWRQIQTLTRRGLERLAPTIEALAVAEGFTAHADSVRVRLGTAP